MKKDDLLQSFVEGVEMTVLPFDDQVLLTGALSFSGLDIGEYKKKIINNCNGGNCVAGCGG